MMRRAVRGADAVWGTRRRLAGAGGTGALPAAERA